MILWKDSVDGPVQTYKLNTVTYGTTCAPYLATRTIQQLAGNEGEHYSLATSVTFRDIYMDDILQEKAELLSIELPTPQQQHMVLYDMLNRSQKRIYLQDSCATNPGLHRFLHNSRNPSVKRSGQLDYSEVNEAELCLIKNLQASSDVLRVFSLTSPLGSLGQN
ncbi:hypothetical protein TNCV_4303251 [Trichonephila clavipes]|nr:hypothetical protein TNCV_4303251 [Trichonephila clavipes]